MQENVTTSREAEQRVTPEGVLEVSPPAPPPSSFCLKVSISGSSAKTIRKPDAFIVHSYALLHLNVETNIRLWLFQSAHFNVEIYIPQRGVQWKQGVVICMLLCTSLPCNTTPHPLHPPPTEPHFDEYPRDNSPQDYASSLVFNNNNGNDDTDNNNSSNDNNDIDNDNYNDGNTKL